MDQVIQGESSSGVSIHPLKRRRGRPRKDPSLKRTAATHVPPGFDSGDKNYSAPRANPMDRIESMVGQAVTGVVEATLDAGYLLNVRIGNSNMNFRGIVFKPGHYVPVTPENDVAPHLQMIKRNDVRAPAENRGGPHSQKLAIQTVPPPKRKYTRRAAPSVPPVGVRGNLVPVVLQPINGQPNSNQTPPDGPQTSRVLDFGDKDVHMVEPLSMLPPERSIPAGQIFLGPQQPNTSCQVSEQNESGHGEKVKPMGSGDIENTGSSETSDFSQMENGKEALKSPAEDSGVVLAQETGNANGPFTTKALHDVSVAKRFFNYGSGRMTELLQALHMKENQVQFAEQIPGSKVELCETTTAENDPKNKASVP